MYLGSTITRDCATEIRMRLAKRYAVATDLKRMWKSHDIKVTTKMELLRILVWPVAIYGCEGWTMREDVERRIEAFEMKCLRMIMQISWTEKRTNKWVLEKAGVERNSKRKKNEILLTHHEKGGIMLGKGDHSRHGSGRTGKRKTDQLDG